MDDIREMQKKAQINEKMDVWYSRNAKKGPDQSMMDVKKFAKCKIMPWLMDDGCRMLAMCKICPDRITINAQW